MEIGFQAKLLKKRFDSQVVMGAIDGIASMKEPVEN